MSVRPQASQTRTLNGRAIIRAVLS
jgi:hypothetical protein